MGDVDTKPLTLGVFDGRYWSNHVNNTDNNLSVWVLDGYINLYLIRDK